MERREGGRGRGFEPHITKTLRIAPVKAQLLSADCAPPSLQNDGVSKGSVWFSCVADVTKNPGIVTIG